MSVTRTVSRPTLLIPVRFPNPGLYPMDDVPPDGLGGFEVVLSGYWELPDQRTETAARTAHETEADAMLYEMAAQFSHAGAPTETRLVFGPRGAAQRDHQQHVAAEVDADGILLADHLTSLLNIVVPLRDSRHQAEIVEFVSTLDADSLFVVELYHVAADEAAAESAREMLRSVEQTLLDLGFSDADLKRTVEVAPDPRAAIVDIASEHHLVVMGETQNPDAESALFGPVCTYISEQSETPVAVVQE